MRFQQTLTFASIALLALAGSAHSRAVPLFPGPDCYETNCNHVSVRRGAAEQYSHLVPRAIIKPPKPVSPKPGSPDSSSGNDPGIGFVPDSPTTSKPDEPEDPGIGFVPDSPTTSKPDEPEDPGIGFVPDSPGISKPGDPNDPGIGVTPGSTTPKPDNQDANDFDVLCKKSTDGLWSRSTCEPGSGDTGPDGGGFASERPDAGTPTADLPPEVGPPVDRTTVRNWYDVVESSPKPQFRAKEEFDRRLGSSEPDKPVATRENYDTLKNEFSQNEGIASGKDIEFMFNKVGAKVLTAGRSNVLRAKGGLSRSRGFHQSTYSYDGKIIIADLSNKAKDPTPPDQQLPWNQLIFSQYKEIMDQKNGGDLKNLQYIGRSEIGSPSTKATIKTALSRTGKTTGGPEEIVTFKADATPGSEEAKAFEALARTDNVNGILFLLSDYHNALGNKRISNINVAQSDSSGFTYEMIIEVAETGD